jgi:hypothetical protein
MKCLKCGYFPCTRNNCDLNYGECEYGKSSVSVYMNKEQKEILNENNKRMVYAKQKYI